MVSQTNWLCLLHYIRLHISAVYVGVASSYEVTVLYVCTSTFICCVLPWSMCVYPCGIGLHIIYKGV